jgi:membrane-associated phospholipid phosphatase
MDPLIQYGIGWIIAIQSLGGWLEYPMKFFTFFGNEDFFFLVLPLIYWSVNAELGLRVALILVGGSVVNFTGKYLFAGPRPYWVSAQVRPFAVEHSFGIPSNHAQTSAALWGTIAAGVGKRWVWGIAILLTFLVGFSRLYLGMHFVHDVLIGWLMGYVFYFVCKFWMVLPG